MARKLKSDKLLFVSTLLLVCSSVVMVYSASSQMAMDRYEQSSFFLFKQITWAMLGICLLLMAMQMQIYLNQEMDIGFGQVIQVVSF